MPRWRNWNTIKSCGGSPRTGSDQRAAMLIQLNDLPVSDNAVIPIYSGSLLVLPPRGRT